jgi:hypothetical protein
LFLSLVYFPARELAAQAKEMQQLYPITGTGLHTVEDDQSAGESAQAPAIGC